jgi:protein-L-isoaspartate(D-aspartate) O-methyltransferase
MSPEPPDFAEQRAHMVRHDLAARDIDDAAVLDAMAAVPRERFVPAPGRAHAYEDRALPIHGGQTISQPYVVAWMLAALELAPTDRLLEVGAGSGYAAAVAGRLCAQVVAVERVAELVDDARDALAGIGATGVTVHLGDGTLGWPADAPYDAILVSAGGPSVPEALVAQLAVGGRLVIPVGGHADGQRLLRVRRTDDGVVEEDLGWVIFVPLIGEQGWPEPG